MYNMIGRIFRPIKEGFFGVGRHAAMSISSTSAVTITLIIISIFLIFTANVEGFTQSIESTVQISALVDYSVTAQEDLDQLGIAISEIDGVEKVTFSSKADEFQYYIDSFEDEKEREIFEPFREDNPMHDAFYVEVSEGKQLNEVAKQIEALPGICKINYGGESAILLVNALSSVRNGGALLVLALSLLAVFLIHNTIKLTILARADEIAIMRNVGASNGFIRAPFVVEGIIIGALGAIIPIGLTVFGYIYLYKITGGIVISNMFKLLPPHPFVLQVSLILLVTGMLVGLLGSYISVTKYLRWKR